LHSVKELVEQYFRELERKLEGYIEAFTVEWRQHEALAQIQLRDDFYVFIALSWVGEDCTLEFMMGDENAVIQLRHLDKLDAAISVIKTAYETARQSFKCLRQSP